MPSIVSQYMKFQSLGMKAQAEAKNKGLSTMLPTLEEILEDWEQCTTLKIGIRDIPLTKIRGTVTKARAVAFAPNFMPVMSSNSEFGSKWRTLYEVQMEEGIESPISVIEYMGYYYVVEGNKRVSVYKALGAVSIRGEISRIIPKKNESKEYRLYQEYLEFLKITDVDYIWMSEEGNFRDLLAVLNMKDRKDWMDDEKASIFRYSYRLFRKAFKAHQGDTLDLTTGDAFLRFVRVINYYSIYDKTEDQLQKDLDKLWPELEAMSSDNPIELVSEPAEEGVKKTFFGLLETVSEFNPKQAIRIAFVHNELPIFSNWTRMHERGRLDLEEAMEGKVKTEVFYGVPTDPGEGCKRLQEIAAKGFDYIFTTSVRHLAASLRAAVRCPDTRFLNCSVHVPYRHVRTYYGRMHEAKFLSGLIAGSMTRTDKIGFIVNNPIFSTFSNVNAFALGVRMVNPYAKVYLDWTAKTNEVIPSAEKRLQALGVDLISSQDMLTSHDKENHFGLCQIDEEGNFTNLATAVWNWGTFYERLIRNLNTSYDSTDLKQAINFWWGLSSGVVDILLKEDQVPVGIRLLVEHFKNSILAESYSVFSGEIRDQQGNLRLSAGEVMDSEAILTMDYLVENVEGIILPREEMDTEDAESMHPVII